MKGLDQITTPTPADEQKWIRRGVRLFTLLFYLPVGIIFTYITFFDIIAFTSTTGITLNLREPWMALFPFIAIFSFLIGIGLWRLHNWARQATVAIFTLGVVIGPLLTFTGTGFWLGLLETLVSAAGLWSFARRSARELFTEATAYSPEEQIVNLTTCPNCRKKTSADLKYCIYCGSDTTIPSLQERLQSLIKKAEQEYRLKINTLSELVRGNVDVEVFTEVYADYAKRVEEVEKNLRAIGEDVLSEVEKHNKAIEGIRKKARELKLRVAVNEIPKQTLTSELTDLNKKLEGIYRRLQNLNRSLESLSEPYKKEPSEGAIAQHTNHAASHLEELRRAKESKSAIEAVEKDVKTSIDTLTYFGKEVPRRLIISKPISFCPNCGNELTPEEEVCPNCKATIKKSGRANPKPRDTSSKPV